MTAAGSSAEGGLTLYEQLSKTAVCTRTKAPRVLGWNTDKRQAIIWRPPCNQWTCPACGQVNRSKAAIRAFLGAQQTLEAGGDLFFLTLTSHERLSPSASWKVLPKAWNKLNRRASRKQPGGQYFAVREHTRRGVAHLHAITTWTMPTRWWKDNGRACGFGFQADTDEVRTPGGAGWYALKYLIKQLEGDQWQQGSRRFTASQSWPALPELEKQLGWSFETIPKLITTEYVMREMKESGFEVALLNKGERLDNIDNAFAEIARIGNEQGRNTQDIRD